MSSLRDNELGWELRRRHGATVAAGSLSASQKQRLLELQRLFLDAPTPERREAFAREVRQLLPVADLLGPLDVVDQALVLCGSDWRLEPWLLPARVQHFREPGAGQPARVPSKVELQPGPVEVGDFLAQEQSLAVVRLDMVASQHAGLASHAGDFAKGRHGQGDQA